MTSPTAIRGPENFLDSSILDVASNAATVISSSGHSISSPNGSFSCDSTSGVIIGSEVVKSSGIQDIPSLSIFPSLILELDIGPPSQEVTLSTEIISRGKNPSLPLRELISMQPCIVSMVQIIADASVGCNDGPNLSSS